MTFPDIGIWQGVAMDSLKFHPGSPCLTVLCPADRQPLKRPYSRFRGGLPTGWADCCRLLTPLDTARSTPMFPDERKPKNSVKVRNSNLYFLISFFSPSSFHFLFCLSKNFALVFIFIVTIGKKKNDRNCILTEKVSEILSHYEPNAIFKNLLRFSI
jgi:hypothetical protein